MRTRMYIGLTIMFLLVFGYLGFGIYLLFTNESEFTLVVVGTLYLFVAPIGKVIGWLVTLGYRP